MKSATFLLKLRHCSLFPGWLNMSSFFGWVNQTSPAKRRALWWINLHLENSRCCWFPYILSTLLLKPETVASDYGTSYVFQAPVVIRECLRERFIALSPVRLFWRSSLPEPWFEERNNVRFDKMMRTHIACAMEIRKKQGGNEMLRFSPCWRCIFFERDVIWPGVSCGLVKSRKTKYNTIWRHRDCNANILGCVFACFLEIVLVSTMVKTKKSHQSPAVFPSFHHGRTPALKRPNLFQGTVAISCVNFIVVPVPRSESVR